MLGTLTLMALLADGSAGQTTMPRQADPSREHVPAQRGGLPADPLFDKPMTAGDDEAFVRAAVENGRQGVMDARAARSALSTPSLKAAADAIGAQQKRTLDKLEALARQKGWDLPPGNPVREGSVPVHGPVRSNADFIIHQIAQHQAVLAKFRAQGTAQTDPELREVIREAVPGYEKNLTMLLGLDL